MNIDYTKMEKKCWFEDADGNEVEKDDPNAHFYRHHFPLEIHDYIDEYCYHPENPIVKFLCRRSKKFYEWISKGKDKTFKTIMDCRTTYSSGQDCIVAMVNSGFYFRAGNMGICKFM